MRRVTPNILEDIGFILSGIDTDDRAAERYGADLLGRAIGHEITADHDGPGYAPILRDIRHAGIFSISQHIMIHQSITETAASA